MKLPRSIKITKRLLIKIIIVFVILLIAIALLSKHDDSSKIVPGKVYGTKKSACEIFHDFNAFQLFGNAPVNVAKKDGVPQDTSKEFKASSCSYTPYQPSSKNKNLSASLLVLAPLTKSAVNDNTALFNKHAKGKDNISGYGEKAYWDEKNGQLNVLKHKTRYVLVFGRAQASDRNPEQTEKLAKILNVKL